MSNIDLSSMRKRLGVATARDERASSLDEDDVADMLLLLADKADEQEKRMKIIEEALRYKGML